MIHVHSCDGTGYSLHTPQAISAPHPYPMHHGWPWYRNSRQAQTSTTCVAEHRDMNISFLGVWFPGFTTHSRLAIFWRPDQCSHALPSPVLSDKYEPLSADLTQIKFWISVLFQLEHWNNNQTNRVIRIDKFTVPDLSTRRGQLVLALQALHAASEFCTKAFPNIIGYGLPDPESEPSLMLHD